MKPKKQRRLDPHAFTPAFASWNCVHCGRNAEHWLHRGWLYRLFTPRPADIQFRRIQ